ncbi:serpin family protein [Solirubrobacter sp. CPCC 204708]|uniref:Serpin family protein n=1 Tax=Solirubrobacter deserti TaxID=2282478 RepID=A0ABT4RPH4_9ACTN|nr:serpin family protein [Solirubrobacter deserti]MBE2319962.1 serpin family protein [Solirubrobacter deserti]MDA0140444.1 serpin family protein [Solirubrobacter deserti]
MLLDQLSGDVVFSPYGLHRALSVIRGGATGETRRALERFEMPPEVPGVVSAQAAWLHEDYRPGRKLRLDTGPLDLEAINAWSSEHTRGMIPRILESLDPDEVFVLTDAEYLDAKWQRPFEDTRPAPFEGVGDVPMMSVEGTFEYADGAVRLPYSEHDLRFVATLGEPGERDWARGHGTVELPRFTVESSIDVNEVLGLSFETGHDLDELIEGPGAKGISRILQRARVDVDEEGTRAAATTAVMARAVAFIQPQFHIVFDRPFTWAIEHAPTGTVLFAGRVVNPVQRRD